MKAHRLMALSAVALCAAVVIALAGPDSYAIVTAARASPHLPSLGVLLAMPVALPALRTQHADLVRQAEARRAEIRDGMPAADVRRIEGEHEALVRQAEDVQRQIAEAEAAERAAASPPAPVGTEIQQAVQAGVAAERNRVASIRDIGRRASMSEADINTAIGDNSTVEAFRTRAFDTLSARSRQAPTSSAQASPGRDENDTRRLGMRDALVARLARASGQRNVQIPEHARAWGEMGFAEMAADCIGWRGHLRTPQQVIQVMERAFHSTSDFPAIFSDALNQRLLARYTTAMPTYRLFAAPYMATDFRAINVVRAGDFPQPQRILETGEIPTASFSESKEQLVVHPYGVRINITRQMIVNDNLGAIDQVLGSYGDTILGWENDLVFALLVSNAFTGPTLLTDSTVMFHANHKNETAAGTAINITEVGKGRAQMMKQKSLDGRNLNLMPTLLLTGPDRLTEAEQLVATINPALIAAAQTEWIKRLRPAGDANITGDHWWLFADPSVAPCFVYGTLQGFEGPRLSTEDPFTVQGVSVKLEHDFGCAGIDYRGATHNEGAPPA